MSGRSRIIALILGAQTVANVGPLGIPAIASLIRADLGLSLAQAGSFLSAFYIGSALFSLPAGSLADRWGVRRTLVLGQLVITLGLLARRRRGLVRDAHRAPRRRRLRIRDTEPDVDEGSDGLVAAGAPRDPCRAEAGRPPLGGMLGSALAGPRAAGTAVGLGLAMSSAGVTLGPLAFGYVVRVAGGYHGPWIALALTMIVALAVLFRVRERRWPVLGST